MLIDDDLRFKNQVEKIKRKLQFYTALRTRRYLKRSQLLVYYRMYVKPIVQYGVLVYGCTAFSNLLPIWHLQKRIWRNIYHMPKHTNVDQVMSENGLETVYELHVDELLKFILKSMTTGHESQLLNEILRKEEGIIYGLTKPPETLALIPITRTRDDEHSHKFRVPTLFNKLNSWGIFPDQSNLADISADSVKSLGQILFDCFVIGNEDLVRFVFGLPP